MKLNQNLLCMHGTSFQIPTSPPLVNNDAIPTDESDEVLHSTVTVGT